MVVVLASSSPGRLRLLRQLGLEPVVFPPNIDESVKKGELPRPYVQRLAWEKLSAVLGKVEDGYCIAADTSVCIGRRILPKALADQDVDDCLRKLSGRRSAVYTGVAACRRVGGAITALRRRVVMTAIKFKRLSEAEIRGYVASKEGIGCAGGYAVRGRAERFIPFLQGQVSNVEGLPLYDVSNMLSSLGLCI